MPLKQLSKKKTANNIALNDHYDLIESSYDFKLKTSEETKKKGKDIKPFRRNKEEQRNIKTFRKKTSPKNTEEQTSNLSLQERNQRKTEIQKSKTPPFRTKKRKNWPFSLKTALRIKQLKEHVSSAKPSPAW